MQQLMFSIFDLQAKAYLPPFFMPTTGMAVRTFTDMVNDTTCRFNQHPKDYTIFKLGTFDDANGSIELELTPVSLHNALSLIDLEKAKTNEISNDSPIQPSPKS